MTKLRVLLIFPLILGSVVPQADATGTIKNPRMPIPCEILRQKDPGRRERGEKIIRRELLAALQSIVDRSAADYGFHVHETDTSQSIGINPDRQFRAASTIKVLILAKLYREIEKGRVNKETYWYYTGSDHEGGTGSIQNSRVGSGYTVKELARRMMKESDNIAANIIIRNLGWQNLHNFLEEIGLPGIDLNRNLVTPKDMSLLLLKIYNDEIVGPELRQEMIDLMTGTLFESRLPKYVSGKVKVAHKIGNWPGTISDVGIVFLKQSPFIISVYATNLISDREAEETMARISEKVYEFQKRRLSRIAPRAEKATAPPFPLACLPTKRLYSDHGKPCAENNLAARD